MDAMLVILFALFATIVQGDYSIKSSKGSNKLFSFICVSLFVE